MGVLLLVTGFVEPGVTASGTYTRPGTAACPAWVPFGTQLSIEGVGVVTCEDRFDSRLSDRIDIFMPTVEDCYGITGRRWVKVIND